MASISTLVATVADLRLDDVSGEIRTHSCRVVADTLGVVLAGGRRREIESYVRGDGVLFGSLAPGNAELLTPGFPKMEPTIAAFVNATAGTFLELDEGYRPTGHPAMHVVPAALAAAQSLHASGREFMAAVLTGYEVTARLFEAYKLTYPVHPHGHFGAVGAAVAVAKLRGADPQEPARIASTLPLLPVWHPCFEGATTRNAYTGTASALGLNANRMSAAGFTGSEQAQRRSFGEIAGRLTNPNVLSEPLDPTNLRITRNYLKLHSACALTHSALDAVMELGPIDTDEVASIEVETVSNNMKVARQAQPNDLSTRFSLPYAVAAAIVRGNTGPAAFEPDERVFKLAERVQVRTADDLEELWPDAAPARVTIRLNDEVLSCQVDNPRGHYSNSASPKELRAKFDLLAGEGYRSVYDRLLDIQEIPDVANLFGDFG